MRSITWMVCLLAIAAMASAQDYLPHADLMPQEVLGTVIFSDGETPVVNFPIRVWSEDTHEFLYRTSTDQEGRFRIPRLKAGRTYLLAGRTRVDLNVLADEGNTVVQIHDIVIVLPRRMLVSGLPVLDSILVPPLFLRQPPRTDVVSP